MRNYSLAEETSPAHVWLMNQSTSQASIYLQASSANSKEVTGKNSTQTTTNFCLCCTFPPFSSSSSPTIDDNDKYDTKMLNDITWTIQYQLPACKQDKTGHKRTPSYSPIHGLLTDLTLRARVPFTVGISPWIYAWVLLIDQPQERDKKWTGSINKRLNAKQIYCHPVTITGNGMLSKA